MTTRNAMKVLGPMCASLVFLPGAAHAADGPPMSVFITAGKGEVRPQVDDATKNALKKKRDEANKARESLEKQIKGRFGKKRETWPPEKDEELYLLEEATVMAAVDYEYRKIDPKEIGDAVQDMTRAAEGKGLQAGKKDRITIAGSAAEADLVVEVMGRRSRKAFGAVTPSECFVLFSVGPGGRTDPAQFARIPATYRPRKFFLQAAKVANPNVEKPAFVFEAWTGSTPFGCHGAAANSAAGLIDKFIEDNQAALKGR